MCTAVKVSKNKHGQVDLYTYGVITVFVLNACQGEGAMCHCTVGKSQSALLCKGGRVVFVYFGFYILHISEIHCG